MATLKEIFQNIANSTRAKTGSTEKLYPADISKEIDKIKVGTALPTESKTVELDFSSGSMSIEPSDGYTISNVTIDKPNTLLAGNIKKGVTVAGIAGSLEFKSQTKTVQPSPLQQDVSADSGYDGLSNVIVDAAPVQSKTVAPTVSKQIVTPDESYYGLSSVTVKAVDNTIDNNIMAENIKNGVTILGITGTYKAADVVNYNLLKYNSAGGSTSSVINNNVSLQYKTVNLTTSGQEFSADTDYTGLNILKVIPKLQTKAIAFDTTKAQTITHDAGYVGLEAITVPQLKLQDYYVYPSTAQQEIECDNSYDALNKVVVRPVTSSIDSNIISENIRAGISILGVEGTLTPQTASNDYFLTTYNADGTTIKSLISKDMALEYRAVNLTSPTPTTYIPSDGYDGFSSIKITPQLQTKTISPTTSSQTIGSDAGYMGLGSVTIKPITLEDKTVTPSTIKQTIKASTNYNGLGIVTVNAVNSSIDSNIKAENIKSGVSILGVTGSMKEYVSPSLQAKTVSPSDTQLTVTADNGYDGLSSVTVASATLQDKSVVLSTKKQVIEADNAYYGLNSVTVPAMHLQNMILTPSESAQDVLPDEDYDGIQKVHLDAIPTQNITINPSTSSQAFVGNVSNGLYKNLTVNPVTSAIDVNIIPNNIKAGVKILGVTGTLARTNKAKTIRLTSNNLSSISGSSAYKYSDDNFDVYVGTDADSNKLSFIDGTDSTTMTQSNPTNNSVMIAIVPTNDTTVNGIYISSSSKDADTDAGSDELVQKIPNTSGIYSKDNTHIGIVDGRVIWTDGTALDSTYGTFTGFVYDFNDSGMSTIRSGADSTYANTPCGWANNKQYVMPWVSTSTANTVYARVWSESSNANLYSITNTAVTALPKPVYYGTTVTIDNNIYIIGGQAGTSSSASAYSDIVKLDTSAGTAEIIGQLPEAIARPIACAVGNDIYIIENNAPKYKFNISTLESTTLNIAADTSLTAYAAVSLDASAYIFCYDTNGTKVYQYDTESDSLINTGITFTQYKMGIVVKDNSIYCFGGRQSGSTVYRNVYIIKFAKTFNIHMKQTVYTSIASGNPFVNNSFKTLGEVGGQITNVLSTNSLENLNNIAYVYSWKGVGVPTSIDLGDINIVYRAF